MKNKSTTLVLVVCTFVLGYMAGSMYSWSDLEGRFKGSSKSSDVSVGFSSLTCQEKILATVEKLDGLTELCILDDTNVTTDSSSVTPTQAQESKSTDKISDENCRSLITAIVEELKELRSQCGLSDDSGAATPTESKTQG